MKNKVASCKTKKNPPALLSGENLNHIAFPMGGIGAGMVCLEGTGGLSNVSLRQQPNIFSQPATFAALSVDTGKKGRIARILEGPVQPRKIYGPQAKVMGHRPNGLPRFADASFTYRFPFATVRLSDRTMPVRVEITGWSPFIPGDADNSSLPCAALEYSFSNSSRKKISAVFSFNSEKHLTSINDASIVRPAVKGGIVFEHEAPPEKPGHKEAFAIMSDDPCATTDCRWFRGGWFDPVTLVWRHIISGDCVSNPKAYPKNESQSRGGSLYVPFSLRPGQKKTIRVLLSWYVPQSGLRINPLDKKGDSSSCCGSGCSCDDKKETHRPWYAARFKGIDDVSNYFTKNYSSLRSRSESFADCFYASTLPPYVLDAIGANLTILKSPTCLRQADGRFWAWEGSCDTNGCCHGSCTHVWNYAQAMPHLFPDLERGMRETEFFDSQNKEGHQNFRASLPIGETSHDFHAAADGQLGGIMKLYREWRVSGDSAWLKKIWPRAKQSLNYCISTWDPDHNGVVSEPHHNTYDIEFWGPDPMCSGFYLGALKAASLIAKTLKEDASFYDELFTKGRQHLENELFNGEYFIQKVEWEKLHAPDPQKVPVMGGNAYASPEDRELLKKEGPKYQYGQGCLSDGVLGAWMAQVCGLGEILDPKKVKSHLKSVYKYNFKKDLSSHVNLHRWQYAIGREGGLLVCTWPNGGEQTLPMVYSNEVFTGIEYQAAAHMIMMGLRKEGLAIVETCRKRHDGRVRNPFDEVECGSWYARAMSSYSLLQALSGLRYDAVDKTLFISAADKKDFQCFLSTAGGYGLAGIKSGKPFVKAVSGKLDVKKTIIA